MFAFELIFDGFRQREIDSHNMLCENYEGLLCRDCDASVMGHCHFHDFTCRECYAEHIFLHRDWFGKICSTLDLDYENNIFN